MRWLTTGWCNIEKLATWASKGCEYTLDICCFPISRRWGIAIIHQRKKGSSDAQG